MDLKGKTAFIAGIGDDQGFGWAIAKQLAKRGATILVGTWVPLMKIFTMGLKNGKFATDLGNGQVMEIAKVYPLDATYETMEEVPEEVKQNKRFANYDNYAVRDVATLVQQEYGQIDFLVHSLANGPEVKNDLLATSRQGYLAALSSSSYSFISLIQAFGPLMREGGSALTISFRASTAVIPGYGGGMSSAKAALESDIRTLAWESGRKWGIRVNGISAGAMASRAAKAIGIIEKMVRYQEANSPLTKPLTSDEIAKSALFLLSEDASAITGEVLCVDNGLHAMGMAVDSQALV